MLFINSIGELLMSKTSVENNRTIKPASQSKIDQTIQRPDLNKTTDPIPWKKFTKRINYSSCNEDNNCELEALKVSPGKRIISITAGGGRILNLLVNQPDEIWAVDVNLCQSYLLELKIAAMRSLDYEDYLAFMGIRDSDNRLNTYKKFEKLMSPGANEFFNSKPNYIKNGILFQGNLERFFGLTSRLVRLGWFHKIRELFEFDDLSEQRKFLEKNWDHFFWKYVIQNLIRKPMLHVFADDPGFLRFLPKDLPVHKAIFKSIHRYLWNNLAKENHLLSMVMFGRYIHEPSIPLYLKQSTFGTIKKSLEKTNIKIITSMFDNVLKVAPAKTFDGYSISDIASYMDDNAFHELMGDIIRTSKPKAMLCARHCLIVRKFPEDYEKNFKWDHELEEKLNLHDHAMVHDFTVGEICGV